MMEYALYGVFALTFGSIARIIHLLTGVVIASKALTEDKIEKGVLAKQMKDFAVEGLILISLTMALVGILFLFAHEGVI